jgi:hypothetical protein
MIAAWHRVVVLLSLLAACGAGTAGAQINVGLRFEYPSVLLFESMHVFVTVQNRTGETIVLNPDGGSNIDLRFLITRETAPDKLVPRSNSRPLVAGILAREGETHESMIDLAHAYGMGGEGRYTVAAEVEWRGRIYRSAEAAVDVVRGLELESRDAALRGYEDLIRRYSLRYWHRDKYEHLFLTVEEPDSGDNLGVHDLGCVVRVFKPALVVEPSGDVLVVHQSAPERYTRTAFRSTRGGFFFVDQVYLREDGTAWEPKGTPAVPIKPQEPGRKESWWSRLWKKSDSKPESPRGSVSHDRPR